MIPDASALQPVTVQLLLWHGDIQNPQGAASRCLSPAAGGLMAGPRPPDGQKPRRGRQR